MSSKLQTSSHLSFKCLDDELQPGRRDTLYALLHDVVAVLVLDALEDVALQLVQDDLLLLGRDRLQGLLDHPAAVHLERQGLDVGAELKEWKMCNAKAWLR